MASDQVTLAESIPCPYLTQHLQDTGKVGDSRSMEEGTGWGGVGEGRDGERGKGGGGEEGWDRGQ